MILDVIKLFRARKDAELAKQIASEMVVDGAIEQLGLPLTIAKLFMATAMAFLASLIIGLIWLAIKLHWTALLPTPLFGAIIHGIMRTWRGVNKGVQIVTERANSNWALVLEP